MSDMPPLSPSSLTLALARAGLIQFGRFVQPDGNVWPLAVRLRWLSSYPALLRHTAAALEVSLYHVPIDRILTTADATPIGVALSLRTNTPLVYSYGEIRDYTAAFAIEGAYDVAHPTLLLADVLAEPDQAQTLITLARRVGLEITCVLAVLDLSIGARETLSAAGYPVRTALSLNTMLPVLAERGFLPPAMHSVVDRWLEEYQRGRREAD